MLSTYEHVYKRHIIITSIIGRHCCLWCSIANADLKVPLSERGRSPERTLATLKEDYTNFLRHSGGDIHRAKFHNNVIFPVILDIPLDQVNI